MNGMPRALRAALVAVVVAAAAGGARAGDAGAPLKGARALKVCAGAGQFWPTMTLALRGRYAWVACKEQARVVRVDTRTGRTVRSVPLDGSVIAVASSSDAVWALDSAGTLYRLRPDGKILRRIATAAVAAYNVWVGGGALWVADDQGARVIRISPRTNRVVARVAVGDGPADMAFARGTAWVINHRDGVLTRIALGTNRPTPLKKIPGDAPERMVLAHGSLWITGRGTDLIKVDGSDGSVQKVVEIGASGIDVAAAGDALWVPTRSATIDPRGLPQMNTLRRVDAATGVASVVVRASARVDVHGIAADR